MLKLDIERSHHSQPVACLAVMLVQSSPGGSPAKSCSTASSGGRARAERMPPTIFAWANNAEASSQSFPVANVSSAHVLPPTSGRIGSVAPSTKGVLPVPCSPSRDIQKAGQRKELPC